MLQHRTGTDSHRGRWLSFLGLASLFLVEFYLLYGLASYISEARGPYIVPSLPIERNIPFLPSFSLFYVSLYPMMYLAPLFCPTPEDLWALFRLLSLELMLATLVFVIFPTDVSSPVTGAGSSFSVLYNLADEMNLRCNAFPSLHVAFAFTLRDVYARNSSKRWAAFFSGWAMLIALSTLFLHQHRLLDVWGGMALAFALQRYSLRPLSAAALNPLPADAR